MSRTPWNAVFSLGACLVCACTGSVAATSDAGSDAPSSIDAGKDVAAESGPEGGWGPEGGPDSTGDDAGDGGSYAQYCAQYLDSDLACVATKCCAPFATCYQSTACSDYQDCLINGCPDAGDADPQTAYAECVDACTMQYPTGQQQFTSYTNCLDMNCYE